MGCRALEEAAQGLDDEILSFARQDEIHRGIAQDAHLICRGFGPSCEDDKARSPLFQDRGNLQGQAAVPDEHRKPDMVRIRFKDSVRALDRRLIQKEIQDAGLDLLPESPPKYRREHGGAQRHGPGRCFDVDGRQDQLHDSAFLG
mgnify:CR=1 FL=1